MPASDAIARHSGLIGHTGFVGSALARQAGFARCYNRANIASIAGESFGTLVCAAAPGSMLTANRAPDEDRARIEALIAALEQVHAERFVLVSTIAVLADFAGGDDEGTSAFQQKLAYGRHRRMLEAFIESHFAGHLIIRLPALFGPGLVKNFVFDLMNPVPNLIGAARLGDLVARLAPPLAALLARLYAPDPLTGMLRLDRAALNADPRRRALEEALEALGASATFFHHPATTYQYYPVMRLWQDIAIAREAGLTHLHLAPEPLSAAAIHERLLGRPMPQTGARLHREDMRTRHAGLWGAEGPYQFGAAATLDRLAAFLAGERVPA